MLYAFELRQAKEQSLDFMKWWQADVNEICFENK
jgi:hypothetical protein